jgi:hypothetical protein
MIINCLCKWMASLASKPLYISSWHSNSVSWCWAACPTLSGQDCTFQHSTEQNSTARVGASVSTCCAWFPGRQAPPPSPLFLSFSLSLHSSTLLCCSLRVSCNCKASLHGDPCFVAATYSLVSGSDALFCDDPSANANNANTLNHVGLYCDWQCYCIWIFATVPNLNQLRGWDKQLSQTI